MCNNFFCTFYFYFLFLDWANHTLGTTLKRRSRKNNSGLKKLKKIVSPKRTNGYLSQQNHQKSKEAEARVKVYSLLPTMSTVGLASVHAAYLGSPWRSSRTERSGEKEHKPYLGNIHVYINSPTINNLGNCALFHFVYSVVRSFS